MRDRPLSWQSAPSFEGIFVHDNGVVVAHNETAAQLLGYEESLVGRSLFEFVAPEGREVILRNIAAATSGRYESVVLRRDGTRLSVELLVKSAVVDGKACRVVAYRDLTERKRLEERLRDAQKMEAIGQLAGGVAHDFNNSLTTITGCASLLMKDLDPESPAYARAAQVRRAAERAATLTSQLLAFGRRQVFQVRVLHLGALVLGLREMLASVLTERVELSVEVDADLGVVLGDLAQLERVVMNLALNARDAMPGGGRLEIVVRNATVAPAAQDDPALPPGPYVEIVVRDHGVGMDEATRARVFEPFFTTKPVGRGTGLGLSSVYGIVKQSGGHVTVESEPGRGSAFHVWLPRVADAAPEIDVAPSAQPAAAPSVSKGRTTILVVEDDEDVREFVCHVLRGHGYELLSAADGAEALELSERSPPVDLLLCDVVMPGLSGKTLAERLVARRSVQRVLFMSGHAADPSDRAGTPVLESHHLVKPFDADTLLARVQRALDLR
jgi:PAS domain S-box-containing protein